MGPEGFINLFDQLLPKGMIRRTVILKGGPGVGKSTFMRRVHAAVCAGGEASMLYPCSGDPDSLDAVAVPHAGLVIMDGTAPHVVDPKIPGARDGIVNLGACLDERAMRGQAGRIAACMEDNAACTRRARASLAAAWALEKENHAIAASATDEGRAARMTRALIRAVMEGEAEAERAPSVRRTITDAVTMKGEMCLLAEGDCGRVIRIARHWAQDVTPVLRALEAACLAAGYGVEEHLNPACPGELLHVTIPVLDTLVTSGEGLASEMTFDFAACLPGSALLRHDCALEQGRAGVQLHRHRASAALTQAKQIHDEIETFYTPHMDFQHWERILEHTLGEVERDMQEKQR